MAAVAELVERLALLTEEHVTAATRMNVEHLRDLTIRRADLQFELRVLLRRGEPIQAPDKDRTRAATERLAQAERRFERVVSTVVRTLTPAHHAAPTTYGRGGRLGS